MSHGISISWASRAALVVRIISSRACLASYWPDATQQRTSRLIVDAPSSVTKASIGRSAATASTSPRASAITVRTSSSDAS